MERTYQKELRSGPPQQMYQLPPTKAMAQGALPTHTQPLHYKTTFNPQRSERTRDAHYKNNRKWIRYMLVIYKTILLVGCHWQLHCNELKDIIFLSCQILTKNLSLKTIYQIENSYLWTKRSTVRGYTTMLSYKGGTHSKNVFLIPKPNGKQRFILNS